MVIEKDSFDSDILGSPVGKAFLDKITQEELCVLDQDALDKELRLVVLFVRHSAQNVLLLGKNGFFYLTSKSHYKKSLLIPVQPQEATPGSFTFVEFDESHLNELMDLSQVTAEKSRYFIDLAFKEVWREAYRQWVRNAVSGYVNKIILSLDSSRKVVGFIFVKLSPDQSATSINLIGVSPNVQGKGIGSALSSKAEKWAREQGCEEMIVITEAENITAQRLYQGRGFQIYDHLLIYSKQYGPS